MAANDRYVAGTQPIRYHFRNYSYSTMQTDLPELSFGLATVIDRLIYRNKSNGPLLKLMVDSGGSENLPDGRVMLTVGGGKAGVSNITKEQIEGFSGRIDGKADSGHLHDDCYSPLTHNHDDKYVPHHNHPYLSDTDPRINNWDTAYGWGDHAEAGYSFLGHTHDAESIVGGIFHADRIPTLDIVNKTSGNLPWSRLSDIPELSISKIVDLQELLNSKQDNLIAGDNIHIASDGKTISATGDGSAPGNGRIDLVIGQAGNEVPVGFFTVNQAGNTKIVLDSSHSDSGSGNEGHLLSNIPHRITISGTQQNPVIEGDGAEIPSNKMFMVIDSSEANNPSIRMWTPLIERAFYVINKFNQTVTLHLSATPDGTGTTLNISGNSGVHFLISQMGISNIIGSVVSFNQAT